ncbi:hypothetical protein PYW08_004515 [Mythimna loreyi]|uniref:Uncharacterized protein n=1 Tax=Mythimna loreyi TaxID=667449 RepID=A0ACC2QP97_9NEOP|nr:hypothetical protein PYW08_004515 [Mythimna loreyi]
MVSYSDVVYYLSLLACIATGEYYKRVDDRTTKRNYGTGLGLLVTWLICGSSMIHSALMLWGNIIIIKCCNRRYIHQLSFAYTWLYLMYMNYNMDVTTNYVLWIHQVIALRLVGLAFEITMSEKVKLYSQRHSLKGDAKPLFSKHQLDSSPTSNQNILSTNRFTRSSAVGYEYADLSSAPVEPSVLDVISYTYYFIGLHRGPYYRWKTFNEHFDTPFGTLGNCRKITEHKCKKAVVFTFIYMAICRQFPAEAYNEEAFYFSHGSDYRYLYNIPQMITYVLQCQIVMMLCTSVFTEAGFGVYPTKTQPLPGFGPSAKFSLLKLASTMESVALEQEYNFAMLRCFQNDALLMGPRMRDTLRAWEMPTRYWFWTNTYKNLIKSNKEVRSAVSFLAWSLWSGISMHQMVICSTLWVHLHLENEYAEMYNTSAMKVPWDIGFSIMRLFCLIYLTPCFVLDNYSIILRYYNSIFWLYHVVLLWLILAAVVVQKQRIMSAATL